MPPLKNRQKILHGFFKTVLTFSKLVLNSPDFNIIETLESILIGRFAERRPKILEDLEVFACEEFDAIPDEHVRKLFKSLKIG